MGNKSINKTPPVSVIAPKKRYLYFNNKLWTLNFILDKSIESAVHSIEIGTFKAI